MTKAGETPIEQRRPTAEEIPGVLDDVAEGMSLRAACRKHGLHAPSTHTYIDTDQGLREQYARAREQRAEVYQEKMLTIGEAAALGVQFQGKKVDPTGARVLLEAVKFAVGRMAPKSGPVQQIDLTSRTRQMTDAEIAAEIAMLEGARPAED